MFLLLPPFRDGALNRTVSLLTPQLFRNAIEMLWQVDIKNVTVPKFRIEENYDMKDVSVQLGRGGGGARPPVFQKTLL